MRLTAATDIGRLLADQLHTTGTSRAELSRRTGIPAAWIGRYARGTVVPSLPTLLRLLDGLGYELVPTRKEGS